MRRVAGASILLFASVTVLTGCSLGATTNQSVHAVSTAHPRSTPSNAPGPVPIATPAATPTPEACHGGGFWAADSYSEAQRPVDCGPIQYATGKATIDSTDVPVSYVVAPGDIWEFIAKRFDVGTAYLTGINSVRRQYAMIVYAGGTINLDPATITTVGDQNGTAYHFGDRLPDPHVPQH